MRTTAKLSDYAAATIEDLAAEGIQLTPTEIITINALAWEVETPSTRAMLARGIPVPIGGATLWPQTLRAAEWYGRVGTSMRPRWLCSIALGYSMAHGYSEGPELDAVGTKAAMAVLGWYWQLRCRTTALILAMSEVLSQEEEAEQPPDDSTAEMGIGEFSAALCAASGISADFWERRCSQGYAFATLSALAAHAETESKQLSSEPTLRAERAMGWYEEKLKRKYGRKADQ